MANRDEELTGSDWSLDEDDWTRPPASRFRNPPHVVNQWYLPHADRPESGPFKALHVDWLDVGWCWTHTDGMPAEMAAGPGHGMYSYAHGPAVMLWRDLDGELEGWTVTVGFVLEDEVIKVRHVGFYTHDGTPVSPSRACRELRVTEAMEGLQRLADKMPWWFSEWPALTNGRPGRRGTPESRYAEWARRRVEASTLAEGPVNKWLAKQWNVSEGSVKQYLHKARDKGLLTPASEPAALTPKAERLLEIARRAWQANQP